ncbi:DUF4232 domain-containing protein [Dactylosporangium sp. NPDC051541]|uniref:DUF4232 domain-containing protein n=1 Tax=Dactylosporangium sp. NPDC051541 TaxID=3363977 RepID=UPI0037B2F2C2
MAGGYPPPSPATSSPTRSQPAPSPLTSAQSTRWHTNDLRITAQGSPGGGAAGTKWGWLVFTNVSKRTCTLYGYPGVSRLTAPTGTQINAPLTRAPDETAAVFTAWSEQACSVNGTNVSAVFPIVAGLSE